MNRYFLRKPDFNDIRDLYRVSRDLEVMRYYGEAPYSNILDAVHEIEWFKSLEEKGDGFRFVITDESNRYIGNIGVYHFERELSKVEMAFQLDRAYWNQGIMTACIHQVLCHCFLFLGYTCVQAVVNPLNIASKKVLVKNGFKYDRNILETNIYEELEQYTLDRCDFKPNNEGYNGISLCPHEIVI